MLLRATAIILQQITVNYSWDPKTDHSKSGLIQNLDKVFSNEIFFYQNISPFFFDWIWKPEHSISDHKNRGHVQISDPYCI